MATTAFRSTIPSVSARPGSNPASHRVAHRVVAMATWIPLSTTPRDYFHTLGISPGASEQDIKKAYRRLALQYHPDVCKGDHCLTQFTQINQAYEILMNVQGLHCLDELASNPCPDGLMGVNDDSWEDWEEWMGWEGADTRDYTSHINYSF